MEKKQRHKWSKDGRRSHTVCTVCGCEKDRGVYSIRYTLNGKVTQVAPECVGVIKKLNKAHVSRRYVLLKNNLGNVFWTIDDGANYEAEGFKVLHRGDNDDEMVKEWQKHYNVRLNGG